LKLAPRRVGALEDENFSALPGRTFKRLRAQLRAALNHDALFVGAPADAARAPALDSPGIRPAP
jgi:hypothetical protein